MQTFIPSAILRPYIKAFLIVESEQDTTNRLLPGTAPVIAFRFKGSVNTLPPAGSGPLPAIAVTGIRKSARLVHYMPHSGNVLVQFREAGMRAFFHEPLHLLFEESISLDNLLAPQMLTIIEEQLLAASDHVQRITIVETLLISLLNNHRPDALVAAAMNAIHQYRGMIKMKALADALFISQDAFEKRFRKTAGTTAKQFASIVRLQHVIRQKQENIPLTHLALEAGYYDQAHFNREFRLFTGQTPSQFFSTPPLW